MAKLRKQNLQGLGFESIVLTITRLFTMVFNICTTKLLSMFLSLEQYGTYSQVLIVVEIVTSLTILGLTDATNFFYNSDKTEDEKHKFLNTIFGIELTVGVLGAFIIIGLSWPLGQYFKNPLLINFLWIMSFVPLFDNFLPMLNVLYISKGKSVFIALNNLFIGMARLLLMFVVCYFYPNLYLVLVVVSFTIVIQVIYFAIYYKKVNYFINPFKIQKEYVKQILKFGIPLALYIIINSLLRLSDKLFLGYFLTTEEIAIYSNAAKLLPFDIITSSLVTVISPKVNALINVEKDYDKLRSLLKSFLSIGFIATFVFAFGALFFCQDLMEFLYDSKYISGYKIFFVYTLVEITRFCSLFMVMMAFGKNKELVYLAIASLVLNVVLNFALYFAFGSLGCAISTFIVGLFNLIYLINRTIRLTNSKIRDIVDIKSFMFCILGCFLAVSIPASIRYFVFPMPNSFLNLLVYYGSYFIIAVGFSFFNLKNNFAILNKYRY